MSFGGPLLLGYPIVTKPSPGQASAQAEDERRRREAEAEHRRKEAERAAKEPLFFCC